MLTAAKISTKGHGGAVYSAAAQDAADEDDMLLKAAEKAAWEQERKQEQQVDYRLPSPHPHLCAATCQRAATKAITKRARRRVGGV